MLGRITSIGSSQPCDPAAPSAALGPAHHARVVVDVSGDASFPPSTGMDPRAAQVLVPCPELARPAFRLDSGHAGPLRVGGTYGWNVIPHPTGPWLATKIDPNWTCRLPHPHPRGGRARRDRAD
ncbi:MAG: hypothetical protein KBG28_22035 [Kofleriaceae bacterium]|nr:hypothetical protein [Kofleriaceae bacterium]